MNFENWNPQRFAELLNYDALAAYKYRKEILGCEIPEEFLEDEEGEDEVIEIPDQEFSDEEEELTAEELRALLKENDIKFFAGAKIEKLQEKAIEHKLI